MKKILFALIATLCLSSQGFAQPGWGGLDKVRWDELDKEVLDSIRAVVGDSANANISDSLQVALQGQTMSVTTAVEYFGYVQPEWFGAVVDDGNDDYAAIQAALNTKKSVMFRDGTYELSQPLVVPTVRGAKYVGMGEGGYVSTSNEARTTITTDGSNTCDTLVQMTPAYFNVVWEKIEFNGINGTDSADVGLYMPYGGSNNTIRDCAFNNFYSSTDTAKGLYLGGFQTHLEHVEFFQNDCGIWSLGSTENHWTDVKFLGHKKIPIYLKYCWGNSIEGIDIEGSGNTFTGAAMIISDCRSIDINGWYSESITGNPLISLELDSTVFWTDYVSGFYNIDQGGSTASSLDIDSRKLTLRNGVVQHLGEFISVENFYEDALLSIEIKNVQFTETTIDRDVIIDQFDRLTNATMLLENISYFGSTGVSGGADDFIEFNIPSYFGTKNPNLHNTNYYTVNNKNLVIGETSISAVPTYSWLTTYTDTYDSASITPDVNNAYCMFIDIGDSAIIPTTGGNDNYFDFDDGVSYTVNIWYKPLSLGAYLIMKNNISLVSNSDEYWHMVSGGARVRNNNTGYDESPTFFEPPKRGEWNMVTLTLNATDTVPDIGDSTRITGKYNDGIRIYRNGEPSHAVWGYNWGTTLGCANANTAYIGNVKGTSGSFLIDNISVHKGVALTMAQIDSLYNNGYPIDLTAYTGSEITDSLSVYFRFEDGVDSTKFYDVGGSGCYIQKGGAKIIRGGANIYNAFTHFNSDTARVMIDNNGQISTIGGLKLGEVYHSITRPTLMDIQLYPTTADSMRFILTNPVDATKDTSAWIGLQ